MNMQFKNPGMLLTVVLGGAALGYTFGMFLPAQRSLAQVRGEIQSRQLYAIDTANVEAKAAKTEARLQEAKAYIDQQVEALPAVADLSLYTGELTGCAGAAGVRIVRFSPQFQQAMGPLALVPVYISVEGDLGQVFDFAGRLEHLPSPLWCQQCTLEADTKEPDRIQAEFELLIFAANIEKSG